LSLWRIVLRFSSRKICLAGHECTLRHEHIAWFCLFIVSLFVSPIRCNLSFSGLVLCQSFSLASISSTTCPTFAVANIFFWFFFPEVVALLFQVKHCFAQVRGERKIHPFQNSRRGGPVAIFSSNIRMLSRCGRTSSQEKYLVTYSSQCPRKPVPTCSRCL
jgi:hypothetical protein